MTTHESETADGTRPEERAREVPETMSAIVQERYGGPEVLELVEAPTPRPGPDQVLIDVEAASLNAYDWHMITGTPSMVRASAGLTRPEHRIPGADVAGVVVSVGSDVSGFRPGDEVFGEIGVGAFAEYAVASPRALVRKPHGVGFDAAAATPLAGLTALQGLRDHGGVGAGTRVVVNGASGGVGTFAVQIAKALGAEVTAVCSTGKVDMARSIGADRVVDYTTEDFTEVVRDQDVLLDNAGTRPWRETSRVLTADGINVTVTGPKHAWFGPLRPLLARKAAAALDSRDLVWFTAAVKQEDLETLAAMLDSGAIRPVVESTHSLADVPEALGLLGAGHSLGKRVVLA